MRPLITVIVPIYNCENYIDKCIRSILNQTYTNIELILVNDGSTDSSLNICYQYAQSDQRIQIIDKKNEGPAAARNTGISRAAGEYISFVDSDDYVDTFYLEYLFSLMENYEADITSCGFVEENQDLTKRYPIELFERECFNFSEEYSSHTHLPFVCWHMLFNTKLLKQNCILFDETIYVMEDFLFNIHSFLESKKMVVDSKILYHRIIRNDSITQKKMSQSYFNKWYTQIYALREIVELTKTYPNMRADFIYKESYNVAQMLQCIERNNIKESEKLSYLRIILKENFRWENLKQYTLRKKFYFILFSIAPITYCNLRETRNNKIERKFAWYI